MDVRIILSAQVIGLLIKTTTSQYFGNPYQQQSYQPQPYQQPYPQQYAQPQPSFQQFYPQMPQSMQTPIQVHIPQSPPQAPHPSRRDNRPNPRSGYDDYSTDYDDTDLSGSEKENVRQKPEVLRQEAEENSLPPNYPPRVAVQPNLVLVPYPYALIVPTTAPAPTVTKKPKPPPPPTPTQPPPPPPEPLHQPDPQSPWDDPGKLRLRINESDIRYRARKTKPTWLPKYGIVPIPDKLAEKLMSQLREVKGLQSRRSVNMENKNGYSSALQYIT